MYGFFYKRQLFCGRRGYLRKAQLTRITPEGHAEIVDEVYDTAIGSDQSWWQVSSTTSKHSTKKRMKKQEHKIPPGAYYDHKPNK